MPHVAYDVVAEGGGLAGRLKPESRWPSTQTSPLVGRSSAASRWRSELLPAPLSPTMATISPVGDVEGKAAEELELGVAEALAGVRLAQGFDADQATKLFTLVIVDGYLAAVIAYRVLLVWLMFVRLGAALPLRSERRWPGGSRR